MCTRTLFKTDKGRVVTGRNMDWSDKNMRTDLWAFKAGMPRHGEKGPNPYTWTSMYHSLIAAGYNCGVTDGINERGLVANMLYLTEARFEPPDGDRPQLSLAAIVQYLLDQCANVNEAVTELTENREFDVTAPDINTSVVGVTKPPTVHLSVSDADGDSAIFECLLRNEKSNEFELVVHHDKDHKVMANSPPYDEQLKIWSEYKEENEEPALGNHLPGSRQSHHRFARASYYLSQLPTDVESAHAAAAQVLAVQRNVAQPLGMSLDPKRPELAQTLWITVATVAADSKDPRYKDLRYYYQETLSPILFWVDFNKSSPLIEKLENLPDGAFSLCLAPDFDEEETEGRDKEEIERIERLYMEKRGELYETLHGEVSEYFIPRKPFEYHSIYPPPVSP